MFFFNETISEHGSPYQVEHYEKLSELNLLHGRMVQ